MSNKYDYIRLKDGIEIFQPTKLARLYLKTINEYAKTELHLNKSERAEMITDVASFMSINGDFGSIAKFVTSYEYKPKEEMTCA